MNTSGKLVEFRLLSTLALFSVAGCAKNAHGVPAHVQLLVWLFLGSAAGLGLVLAFVTHRFLHKQKTELFQKNPYR